MEISLREALARPNGQERDTYTCFQEKHLKGFPRLVLERGFFFLLITRGAALFTDTHGKHPLRAKDLILLTPGMTGSLEETSTHFRLWGLYIFPDYFDRLTDGGTFYNQYTKYLRAHDFAPIRLARQDDESLRRTFPLFDRYEDFSGAYRPGIVRHLCSLFLLQLSDIVARHNDLPATYLKRSNEIFRLFKKLSIEHYRSHRDLAFYADRLHVSTTYLSRIVKKTTGHTAHFLLSELICADAKKWLESTDTDVKEIADRYEFSDQSAFGKFFKKKTGFSPLAFRQRGNPLPVSSRTIYPSSASKKKSPAEQNARPEIKRSAEREGFEPPEV